MTISLNELQDTIESMIAERQKVKVASADIVVHGMENKPYYEIKYITLDGGQPIYDTNKNKLGYLGIGLYNNLNYTNHSHNIDIPCYYWMICNPTQYCKDGIIIHTYWQNFNESVKEHNED